MKPSKGHGQERMTPLSSTREFANVPGHQEHLQNPGLNPDLMSEDLWRGVQESSIELVSLRMILMQVVRDLAMM